MGVVGVLVMGALLGRVAPVEAGGVDAGGLEVAVAGFDPIAQSDTVSKPTPPRPSNPPDTLTAPDAPFTPGRAEQPAGGLPNAPADTSKRSGLITVPNARVTASSRSDPRLRPTFDRPRWVMLRSLAFPGWGQFHNKAYFKAVAVAAGEGALIAGVVGDELKLTDLQREVDAARVANDNDRFIDAVNAYNDRLDRATSRRWFLGAILAYSLVDAYVDSHFIDIDLEFDRDPAMPAGTGDAKPTGAKLRMSWAF